MNCECYLRRGVVYIPTLGMMDKGFYLAIEPVAVAPLSNTDAVRRAFADTIERGNPKVSIPKRTEYPPPVILKYAGVKSWSTFARDAWTWGIEEQDGMFKIVYYRKDPPNGWTEDRENIETFPPGTAADASSIAWSRSCKRQLERSRRISSAPRLVPF
jgi:hypothetical protein